MINVKRIYRGIGQWRTLQPHRCEP